LLNFTSFLSSFTETLPDDAILFANFNNDDSCVVVGTNKGFRVYNTDPFHPHPEVECGACQLASMLFSTSLFALVGNGDSPENSTRRLRLYNASSKSQICELNFKDSVLNVKMSKQRMVAVLPDKIHIFDMSGLTLLHCLDTPENNDGICDFCFYKGAHLLAFPTSTAQGKAMIFDALNLQVRSGLNAHESPIRCLKFNPSGTLIATASTQGTIVRVLRVSTGERLFEFRRGTSSAIITSISFSKKDPILAVSSSNNTVHLFSYENLKKNSPESERKSSTAKSIIKAISEYAPPIIKKTLQPERAFTTIEVKPTSSRSSGEILCTGFHSSTGRLLIASKAGVLFQYEVQPVPIEKEDEKQEKYRLVGERSLREKSRQDEKDEEHAAFFS